MRIVFTKMERFVLQKLGEARGYIWNSGPKYSSKKPNETDDNREVNHCWSRFEKA